MGKKILPKPGSKKLELIVSGAASRAIYAVLYKNTDKPLSMAEIRDLLGLAAGEQEHLNRRLRDLYGSFNIEVTRRGRETLYRLISLSENPHQTSGRISARVRAFVLRDKRCRQCGKTPAEDGVKLHVDHIIPQEWGGTDDEENLQALCAECNLGKKNYYSSYDGFAEKIREAIKEDEPHKRLGELLKAFKGEPVPSELLEVVAKAKQYQDDWQKRLRELRKLGWKFFVKRRKEGSRSKSYYILTSFKPWPKGNVRAEIARREQRKRLLS